MSEKFNLIKETKLVDSLAQKACLDWIESPQCYNADAAKLSQEISKLAQEGHLDSV